jgi:hypothetical protein
MKRIARKYMAATMGTLLLTLGGLGGCGSAASDGVSQISPGSTDAGRRTASQAPPTEVESITAYGKTVTFYSATLDNGQTNIGLREKGSSYDTRPLVAPLLSQKLTSQEIYLTLAPQGAIAPPALVAVQAQEAARLGRSAEVQRGTVPLEFEQKNWSPTLGECETDVFDAIAPPGGSGSYWQSTIANSFSLSSTGGSTATSWPGAVYETCDFTSNYVIMGTCNPSASSPYTYYLWEDYGWYPWNLPDCAGSYYNINGNNGDTVEPGWYYHYYWINSGGADYYQQINWTASGSSFFIGGVQE